MYETNQLNILFLIRFFFKKNYTTYTISMVHELFFSAITLFYVFRLGLILTDLYLTVVKIFQNFRKKLLSYRNFKKPQSNLSNRQK